MIREVPGLHIRPATPDDAVVLNAMVHELATFEHLEDVNESTIDSLRAELSRSDPTLQAVMAELDGEAEPVGMATFFETYSTFAAHRGMYIEDIYVREQFRYRGIGSHLLRHLARIAKERDYRRLEWLSLVWNADALEFYERFGARPSDAWTNFRLSGEWLDRLAQA
ncbi:MAG: N-acetyltransferase family protein [Planctomycetota bacterium]